MRRIPLHIAALAVFTLIAARDAASAAPKVYPLQTVQSRESILVTIDDKTVLECRCSPSPLKPYVKQLATPAGVQILRDSPADHKHHHGLMFAVGVDGVDFWAEEAGAGTQKPVAIEAVKSSIEGGVREARFVQQLEWINPRGPKSLLAERRAIEVAAIQAPKPATLLTWNTRLSPAKGVESVKLDGHHYYGLGMRFLVSMDQGGRFFNSAGTRVKWSVAASGSCRRSGPPIRPRLTASPSPWPSSTIPRIPATRTRCLP